VRDWKGALRNAVDSSQRPDRTDDILVAIGSLESHLLDVRDPPTINDAEFKVFSQFGEDGAIQYLVRRLGAVESTFIEIGVESYRESNTRFLAMHNNWRGLAIDGTEDHARFLASSDLGWRCDVAPVQAFVTRDNINDLITEHGFAGELGLLSIDVDGMDYWLWDALECVRPAIVIIEFNSIFGPHLGVTVPYDPGFVVHEAHWSYQYFGASLAALDHLAKQKDYVLVGATSNAVNAFFVRSDLAGSLDACTPQEAWRPSRFLSSRDKSGQLSRVRSHRERLQLIRDLPMIDVTTGQSAWVRDLFDL
jgi:hypothetical protein